MKKIVAVILALILSIGFVSCTKDKGDTEGSGTQKQTDGTSQNSDTTDEPIIVTDGEDTTEPEETEPPVPEVPASGYCAVGEVDAEGKLVAVLFGNGLVKTMSFAGDAPASGTVMYFETEGDKIAFASVEMNEEYNMWRVYAEQTGDLMYNTDGTTEWRHYFDEAAVGFVKFSDTSWMAFSGKKMINIGNGVFEWPNTAWPSNLWAYDADGNTTLDLIFADATMTYDNGEVTNVTLLFSGDAVGFETGDKTVTIER